MCSSCSFILKTYVALATKYNHHTRSVVVLRQVSVVSIAHLGSDVVDAEQTLAERGLVDAFVAGGEVSNRPKLDLSRFILPPREA